MTRDEIKTILDNHARWLADPATGKRADLRYADLRYMNLRCTDLRWADLRYANLRWADLRYADLRWADLRDVDFRDANLHTADLRYADLRNTDLRDVDFRDANLRYADLRYTDLRNVDLNGATIWTGWRLEKAKMTINSTCTSCGGKLGTGDVEENLCAACRHKQPGGIVAALRRQLAAETERSIMLQERAEKAEAERDEARATCAAAERELSSLREIVEKLPVYADTGQRFIPGRDACFLIANGRVLPYGDCAIEWSEGDEEWKMHVNGEFEGIDPADSDTAYSTEAAAQTAAPSEKENDKPGTRANQVD